MAALCLTACEADRTITGVEGTDRTATPTIGVSAARLTFRLYAFDASRDPPPQAVAIINTGGGTLAWSARDNMSWITLGSATGTAPSRVWVRLDRAGMHLGMHGYRPQYLTGVLTLSAGGASNAPVTIPVAVYISYLPPSKTGSGNPGPGCGANCGKGR
jgi:hypothetical protein